MFGGLMKSYRSRQAARTADRFSGGLPVPAIHIDLRDGFDHDDVVLHVNNREAALGSDVTPISPSLMLPRSTSSVPKGDAHSGVVSYARSACPVTDAYRARPPISFTAARSRVEISDSGGRRNMRMVRGLLLKIRSMPATASSMDRKPSTIRRRRWGGFDMEPDLLSLGNRKTPVNLFCAHFTPIPAR